MMMFDETIRALWFVELPDGDWMAALNTTDDGFSVTMRFRWYRDEQAFDSNDEKRWSKVTITRDKADEARAIEMFTDLAAKLHGLAKESPPSPETFARALQSGQLPRTSGFKSHRLVRGEKTLDAFMKEFMGQPFVHYKTEKIPPKPKRH